MLFVIGLFSIFFVCLFIFCIERYFKDAMAGNYKYLIYFGIFIGLFIILFIFSILEVNIIRNDEDEIKHLYLKLGLAIATTCLIFILIILLDKTIIMQFVNLALQLIGYKDTADEIKLIIISGLCTFIFMFICSIADLVKH
jgi:hypothetical protein